MVANIVCIAAVGVALFFAIRKMYRNVKSGKSISGCDGNCSNCSGCNH